VCHCSINECLHHWLGAHGHRSRIGRIDILGSHWRDCSNEESWHLHRWHDHDDLAILPGSSICPACHIRSDCKWTDGSHGGSDTSLLSGVSGYLRQLLYFRDMLTLCSLVLVALGRSNNRRLEFHWPRTHICFLLAAPTPDRAHSQRIASAYRLCRRLPISSRRDSFPSWPHSTCTTTEHGKEQCLAHCTSSSNHSDWCLLPYRVRYLGMALCEISYVSSTSEGEKPASVGHLVACDVCVWSKFLRSTSIQIQGLESCSETLSIADNQ
jgi:hypothetical protein